MDNEIINQQNKVTTKIIIDGAEYKCVVVDDGNNRVCNWYDLQNKPVLGSREIVHLNAELLKLDEEKHNKQV